MKKITLFLALFVCLTAFKAQQTCVTSVNTTTATTCNYSSHTTNGTEYWLKFTATSPTVNISLVTVKFGINAPHVHNLALLTGVCGNQVLIAEDELPFVADAKELAIDLNASGLVIGQIYYIRATRTASLSVGTCDKSGCTANNSTDPTVFDVCVQDINVIIPKDFGLELPQSSHAYTTNRGQLIDVIGNLHPEIKMYNDRTNPAVYIADDKISYVFSQQDTVNNQDTLQRIDATLVGGNTTKVFKTEQTTGITNYYLEHIPAGVTGNKSYSRAVCNEVYPNIDMQYYSNSNGIKQYFIVKPGGNADDIILKFDGATAINVTLAGGLEIVSSIGTLSFEPPHAYQVNQAGQVVPMPWQANFIQLSSNTVKFDIRHYPNNMPLFIQVDRGHSLPVAKNIDNLLWSTYYGSSNNDYIYDVDNDDNGDVYYAGYSWSSTFPATTFITSGASFLVRTVVGSHLPLGEPKWRTMYGSYLDFGFAIATDKFNNVYVTGLSDGTSSGNPFITFPQVGAYNKSPASNYAQIDYAFLLKFDQLTGARTWGTVFGDDASGASFWGRAIATDDLGNVYLAGTGERKSNFPIVNGSGVAYTQNTLNTKMSFIAMFDVANNALQWSTMFGNNDAIITEINTNSNGDLFITGQTTGTNINLYPMAVDLPADYQQVYGGGANDAFVAKFDAQNRLKWSSFFGGIGTDRALGIDYDEANQFVYLTGSTNSDNSSFPLQSLINPGVYNNNVLSGGSDGFISVFGDPTQINGNILHYSTYYGGSSNDQCGKLDISNSGNVYITGTSKSQNLNIQPLTGSFNQSILENDPTGVHEDAFVLGINNTQQLKWSTFYGGERYYSGSNSAVTSTDEGNGIAMYNDEILYVGGNAASDLSFPITVDLISSPNAFIQYNNAGAGTQFTDGFLAQFNLLDITVSIQQYFDIENSTFGIYPNPSNGELNIYINNKDNFKEATIEIVDVQGKQVYKEQLKNLLPLTTHKLDFSEKAKGLYIIRLKIGDKESSSKFIID